MRVGEDGYRWEFRLRTDEQPGELTDRRRLLALIASWTPGIPDDELHVLGTASYTFRAQVADRWRTGRNFLLGDAAHLTPPFVGQGMGAGTRDAHNSPGSSPVSSPAARARPYSTPTRPNATGMHGS
jgi:3-(3-hydroxy-phenyl)propionate hydroxylase